VFTVNFYRPGFQPFLKATQEVPFLGGFCFLG